MAQRNDEENPYGDNPYDTDSGRQGGPTNSNSTRNWNDAGGYADQGRYNGIKGFYNTYLGRDPDQAGFDSWYNNGNDLATNEAIFRNSDEAKAYAASQKQAPSQNPNQNPTSKSNLNMPQGIDPRLAQLYQKYGLQPGDRGTGFADWQYWQNDALKNASGDWNYIINRLDADLAGNGQDQPTGTPGSGSWSSSGRGGGGFSGGSSSFKEGSDFLTPGLADKNQQLIDLLMGRAQASLDIDPTTDKIIKPQVDNYAAAQTREGRNFINDQAESGNPYATGAMNNTRTQVAEKAAQNTANLQSQLVQNELTSRRTEIQNALSELGSLLTADQQMALQRELGMIDAGLRQQQINSGNDQFWANFNLNSTDRANYWDWVRSGGGR